MKAVLWIRIGFHSDPAFISMRIRIQGANPLRIHADPDPGQANKYLNFYMKNIPT
jgi:hypothetical protein